MRPSPDAVACLLAAQRVPTQSQHRVTALVQGDGPSPGATPSCLQERGVWSVSGLSTARQLGSVMAARLPDVRGGAADGLRSEPAVHPEERHPQLEGHRAGGRVPRHAALPCMTRGMTFDEWSLQITRRPSFSPVSYVESVPRSVPARRGVASLRALVGQYAVATER
jgi:hypothetical protein